MKFFTVEKIGPNQSRTPEGFLLCENVPLARTGSQKYHPSEVDLDPNSQGYVVIHRDADAVFHPAHVASYNGKAVVNEHPDRDIYPNAVVPETWNKLARGVIMNPRRGTGNEADLLIGDLLITEPGTIRDVLDGKREVSCGYEADYEEIAVGEGRQVNMIGNHVALVEAGRCGARCAIGDSRSKLTGDCIMPTRRTKINDAILKAFKDSDEEGLKAALEENKKTDDGEMDGGEQHIHIHSAPAAQDDDTLQAHMAQNAAEHKAFSDRLDALEARLNGGSASVADSDEEEEAKRKAAADAEEAETKAKSEEEQKAMADALAEEAPDGEGEKAKMANDSVYLGDAFQVTVSEAEILAPGIRLPVYDQKARPKATYDSICGLRRAALDSAYRTDEGKDLIEKAHGKALDISKLSCAAVRPLFKAVVAMKRTANDLQTVPATSATGGGLGVRGIAPTLADLNKRNQEFWDKQIRSH